MANDENMENDDIDWAWQLIIPDEAKKRRLCNGGQVLIHNTRADKAKDILKKPELWLRNARTMKDEQEVRLGRDCVDRLLASKTKELSTALNAIAPNLWGRDFDLLEQ